MVPFPPKMSHLHRLMGKFITGDEMLKHTTHTGSEVYRGGNSPSERNPIRMKAFFDITERIRSFWRTLVLVGLSFRREFALSSLLYSAPATVLLWQRHLNHAHSFIHSFVSRDFVLLHFVLAVVSCRGKWQLSSNTVSPCGGRWSKHHSAGCYLLVIVFVPRHYRIVSAASRRGRLAMTDAPMQLPRYDTDTIGVLWWPEINFRPCSETPVRSFYKRRSGY